MADLEAGLKAVLAADATLAALVGTRIYSGVAPKGVSLPRLTYQRISTTPRPRLRGAGVLPTARVQIDAWAATDLSASAVLTAVLAVLDGARGTWGSQVVQCSRQDGRSHDAEPPQDGSEATTYRQSLDVMISYQE